LLRRDKNPCFKTKTHTYIYYKSEFSVFSFMVRKRMGGDELVRQKKE